MTELLLIILGFLAGVTVTTLAYIHSMAAELNTRTKLAESKLRAPGLFGERED